MSQSTKTSGRIHELDLLRGFFIVVIILDHLQFWPSPFQYLTGQGRLWVSAAEGFFLISGLLIGYLRIYKSWRLPLKTIARTLLSRAGLLYVWGVGITFIVVALTTLLPGDGALLPRLPDAEQVANLPTYLLNVFTMNFASDWIYFLRLYAIMLAVTPLFIWLIRRHRSVLAFLLVIGVYAVSIIFGINEGAMQWQLLFFGAAFIGWKLEYLRNWFAARPELRTVLSITLIVATLITMIMSYFFVHGWSYVESSTTSISRDSYVSIRANVDPLFSNNPLVPLRVLLAFVWFGGLLMLINLLRPAVMKWLRWLLEPFGQASLTAYCLQALVLPFVVTFVPMGRFWFNGLIGALVVLMMWGLLKIPVVKRLLPR